MTPFRKVRKLNQRREKTRPYLVFLENMINSSPRLLWVQERWWWLVERGSRVLEVRVKVLEIRNQGNLMGKIL
jgi:hypothetical protein